MSPNAEGYLIHTENREGTKFSSMMEAASAPHAVHMAHWIHCVFVAFTARITAMTETRRKAKSMARHQVGASLQQVLAQACATKRKGVATQWIMHRKLAAAPRASALMERAVTGLILVREIRGEFH